MRKRLISLFTSLFILISMVGILPVMTSSAETPENYEYTINDVESLLTSVPKYLQYYTDESATDLKNILAELDIVNLETCSPDELKNYYDNISDSLNKLEFKTAEVPQVYVSTVNENGNQIGKPDGYVDTAISIVDTDGQSLTDNAGVIKVRGNSTSVAPKKPFTFKLSSKQNVLGMGKSKKWILLANCFDPTLLRNYVAFDFAQYMGLEYTTEKRNVELWVDGVFKGCYLLVEQVEAGKTRVDVDTDNNEFIVEYEAERVEDDVTYLVSNGRRFSMKDPEELTDEQLVFVQGILDNVTGSILTHDIDEYSKYIDVDSFVKYYILNEFYKTIDFGYSSVYYYYKNGKLYAGPPWDYDLSTGNANLDFSEGYNNLVQTSGISANKQLYKELVNSPEFMELVKNKYIEYHDYIKNLYSTDGLIDTFLKENANVIERNFTDAGWDVSFQYTHLMRKPDATYEENVAFYKNWLAERDQWLMDYWDLKDEPQPTELKYQLMLNDDDTTNVRFILEADEQEVLAVDSASVYATILEQGDAEPIIIKRAYRSIIANGETITAGKGKVFVLGKYIGIPDEFIDGMTAHFTLGENTYERTINS